MPGLWWMLPYLIGIPPPKPYEAEVILPTSKMTQIAEVPGLGTHSLLLDHPHSTGGSRSVHPFPPLHYLMSGLLRFRALRLVSAPRGTSCLPCSEPPPVPAHPEWTHGQWLLPARWALASVLRHSEGTSPPALPSLSEPSRVGFQSLAWLL